MKKLLISISLLLCVNAIYATNYYVSSVSGDDANAGTLQFPWRTLTKVSNTTFAAGDIINLAGGEVFTGTLFIHNSGTLASPIIYKSYGTGQAIITGFVTVGSFSSIQSNVWESVTSPSTLANCNVVLINGVNYAMGRYPNSGYLTYQSFTSNSITSSFLNSSVTNWSGAEAVIRKNNFVTERDLITSASAGTLFYTATGVTANANYGFFIQNDFRTLDAQNEWYYNPTTKKLDIYSNTSPPNVQASTTNVLIATQQKDYITFSNLSITGANQYGFSIPGSNGITIQNCTIDYCQDAIWGFQNWGRGANNLKLLNNTINHTNNNGVNVANEFTNAILQGNRITNTGMLVGMGGSSDGSYEPIQVNGAGTVVQYNIVDSCGYNGIVFYGNNDTIRNNFVRHYCAVKMDGAGIYTWYDTKGITPYIGLQVSGNIVLDGLATNAGTTNTSKPIDHSIYLDGRTSNVEVVGNTASGNHYSGLFVHYNKNIYAHGNTLYNNGNEQLLIASFDAAYPDSNLSFKNNKIIARDSTQRCTSWESSLNNILTFGTAAGIDSNYLARPVDDNLTIQTALNNYTLITQRTLAMWQTYSGFDLHSAKSPVTVANTGQLFFAYNPNNYDSTVTIPSGSWKDVTGASFTTSTVLHAYTSIALMSSGALITPVITYNNPASIVYGTALSSTQLNATANVPGSFTYTIGSTTASVGQVLNAGTYTITANFTPTDPTTYASASKTVTLIVTQAPATLTATGTTVTYNTLPQQPTITTSPAGLTVISTTYNGVSQIPTNAGVYSCVSGLTNGNYSAPPISYTFTINKAPVTITVSNLVQTYTGSPLPVTVTTSPSVTGITVTYDGSTTPSTNAGPHAIVVTLTNANYTATTVNTTLVINKATPTVTWVTPSAITYGTALSGTQLNATASVAGTFAYTPASGTILNAGTNLLSVNFTPTDTANYNVVNNTTVSLVVNKATATITITNFNQFYDGNPKPVTVTTNPVGLTVITVTYNGSTTVASAPGSYSVNATLLNSNYTASPATGTLVISTSTASILITNYSGLVYNGNPQTPTVTCAYSYTITYNGSSTAPTNAGSYTTIATINDGIHTGADTVTMTIIKATPVIVWNNPSAITYGTALSATQLNASSTVAGTFTYTPASGTILNAGTYVLSVSFVPTDTANYNTATKTVNLTVNKAAATLNLSNLNQVYDGQPKPVSVTSSPSNLSGITVTYNGSSSIPTIAGSYAISVILVNSNYTASNVSGTLIIGKASSILSWATPAAVQAGTALSSVQLNATSTGSGSFTYNPTFGYVVQSNITLNATFTPTDTVNYQTQTISVLLSVYGTPVKQHFIKKGQLYPVSK